MSTYEILSKTSPALAAQELVDHLCNNANESNVDYAYDLSQGKMIETGDANTTYKFDTIPGTIFGDIISSLAEENEISEDLVRLEDKWKNEVIAIINDIHIDAIRQKLRSTIFKNISEDLVPMSPFRLDILDFAPRPEVDFLVVVRKGGGNSQGAARTESISQELAKIHAATGEPLNDIVARKKAEGDSSYNSVSDAYTRKYIYDVEMSFFVDYSLTPQEEFIKKMRAKSQTG